MFICPVLFILVSCQSSPDLTVITVKGPIPASRMGITLVHEHLLVDFAGADSAGVHRWEREDAVERITPFLNEIRELGVRTLIECTPAYLGREPLLLRELSEKTGLHLLTNTGYYGAHDNRYLPSSFYQLSVRELAAVWIDEFNNGINGSGVRPGFIKIAVGPQDSLSADHQKIVSAAALAHNQTGLVIASHTGPDIPAFEQMRILKTYGIRPSSFIWVHAQRGTLEGNIKAAREGAWISLDNINGERDLKPGDPFSIGWYADRILVMKEKGLLEKVLVSHDAGWYTPGEENGGEFRGFTDIFKLLIPALKERGFTEKEINQLLKKNPQNAFSLRKVTS
ncbi:MAG TPA: phosphotriesterase [Bacteroides sp.]|nr:phosphotriesterase [Bacteroides sp.]